MEEEKLKLFLISASLIITINSFSQSTKLTESEDRTKIAYSTVGSGELTLFLILGWCCNKEFWKFQTPHFSGKNRTVSIDLAGFGESETREVHSFEDWEMIFCRLLKH